MFVVLLVTLMHQKGGKFKAFYIHYDNMPMQYTVIFHGCKNDDFQMKILIFFSYF